MNDLSTFTKLRAARPWALRAQHSALTGHAFRCRQCWRVPRPSAGRRQSGLVAAGGIQDDWDTYDRVMREERRAAVLITPGAPIGTRQTS